MKKNVLLILTMWISSILVYSQVEIVPNGSFEEPITYEDGYGFYSGSVNVPLLDNMRVDTVAFEGTSSVRIFDHTWGTFLWNYLPGYIDNSEYTVTFWYKGDEPMKFSMFLGRDLGYDLGTDPDNIVPGNAVVADDQGIVNAKVVWGLEAKSDWTKFSYTFRIDDWIGNDPISGLPIVDTCIFIFENTSYAMDDGPSSYVDNISIKRKNLNELMLNGSFEGALTYDDGFGFYSGSVFVPLLDDMRIDSVAIDGTHSVRIFDHTWGTFLWDLIKGFNDSTGYDVSFWWKGDEPMQFSMFLGRDLGYDLLNDPENIVPDNAFVFDDEGYPGSRIIWSLPATEDWTEFSYFFNISNWVGIDPISGEPNPGECTIMWGSTSYLIDDGPSSFVDNVSIMKTASTLSIPEIEKATPLAVFPNPASQQVSLRGATGNITLQVLNICGKLVEELHFTGQNIDIANLPAGFYFLKGINAEGNLFFGKFVKE